MSRTEVTVASRPTGARGMKWMLSGMVVAVAATFALSAWAMPGGYGHHGLGERGGYGMMMGGSGIDRMLDGLNASDAQRSQIKQIFKAAADDLKGQREQRRALRERSMQIISASNVDAAAAESVRQQMLQQHDQASKRMLQAMLDASQVLTPEQRAQLGERMKQRSAVMHERVQRMERERSKQ
ncbi:Spy/CpxP family protein refolding chaperone [uncultured Piscinibacter sp.]|uniref:Spy/CpxP family protein refolding chaperone n=1 Tax=uncultured Piscinibacter sp. TaxID=1131835 RepID=UPI002620930B|nr:Spy/CpxP family protein refolding chaperone [uncultured Piscinibacter sp.]